MHSPTKINKLKSVYLLIMRKDLVNGSTCFHFVTSSHTADLFICICSLNQQVPSLLFLITLLNIFHIPLIYYSFNYLIVYITSKMYLMCLYYFFVTIFLSNKKSKSHHALSASLIPSNVIFITGILLIVLVGMQTFLFFNVSIPP